MKKTIYGFLEDDALRLSANLDLDGSMDQGFGMLTGEPLNYFVSLARLGDGRGERGLILDSSRARGRMSILFDQDRADVTLLRNLTGDDNQQIFNIAERIYFQQQMSDSNIEKLLTTAPDYTGYVANSFVHSPEEEIIRAFNTDNVEKHIPVKYWFAFDYHVAAAEEDITFHIYVHRDTFKKAYPYVTILRVTPPYEPKLLIDPASLVETVNMELLNNSSSYIFGQLNTELASRDQSGTHQFSTKYVINAQRQVQLVFGVTYAGPHVPTSLECREAIRNFLLERTGVGEDDLKPIFPELFIEARYYIVPIWDRYTQMADRRVYPSIFKYTGLLEIAHHLFPTYEEEFLEEHVELLTNAQNKMWSFALPDALNKEKHFSLLAEYDTYQDYSTQSAGWKYMPQEVQEFAGKLIRCMAVASGDTTSTEFESATEGNLVYLVFLTSVAEFYLLTEDSYVRAFADS